MWDMEALHEHPSEFRWQETSLVTDRPRTQREFFFRKYYDFFRKLGEGHQNILEVGCGRCTIGQYFARDGKEVTCSDINPHAIEIAKENFSRAGLYGVMVKADAAHLPFADGSFDLSISVGLLEHLERDDMRQCLREQYRVLKPNGMLAFINVPQKFSIQTLFQKHDHYHRERLAPEDYARACREAGFGRVEWFYINPFPLMETRHELFWARVYQTVYRMRSWFMAYPMKSNRVVSQAHVLLAVKR
ncbi:MAG: hypothetical protein Greene071436_208 [Parcubacteria group bacterium Greene0714_36]|nr:MAG: hypothetical protein Greene071436_208 [Parcubacteria group bacterium Greene0714_36]